MSYPSQSLRASVRPALSLASVGPVTCLRPCHAPAGDRRDPAPADPQASLAPSDPLGRLHQVLPHRTTPNPPCSR
eukprot:862208-Rhodomonas_salina.4